MFSSVAMRASNPRPGGGDRERELRVGPARLDALVAHDAAAVVAHVEVVVDLHRLRDGLRGGPVRGVVVAGVAGVAVGGRRRGRSVAAGVDAVVGHPALHVRARLGQVGRGREQLQHHAPAVPDALGVRPDHHPVLGPARARRHERPAALDVDHADAAGVDRGEVRRPAQRGGVRPAPPASCSASRIVAPSGTRTSAPSTVSVTSLRMPPSSTGSVAVIAPSRSDSSGRRAARGRAPIGPPRARSARARRSTRPA